MLDVLKTTLDRLRKTLSEKGASAQGRARDERTSYHQQSYAAGESHAYNDASDDVRAAHAKANPPVADDERA